MPICLHIFYGSFPTWRDQVAYNIENIYYLTLYKNSLLTPDLKS